MKRVIASLAAASLFAIGPGISAPAFADPTSANNPIIPRCLSMNETYTAESLGNCVALETTAPKYFSETGGAGFLAQICAFYMNSLPDNFYAVYDSYNDCILDAATQLN